MKNNVCITITGESGCGKSSIAYKMKQVFEALGADVLIADDNGDPFQNDLNEVLKETVDKRIKSIINKGLRININTDTTKARSKQSKIEVRTVLNLDEDEASPVLGNIPNYFDKIWTRIDEVAAADIVICDGKVLKNRDGVCFKEHSKDS